MDKQIANYDFYLQPRYPKWVGLLARPVKIFGTLLILLGCIWAIVAFGQGIKGELLGFIILSTGSGVLILLGKLSQHYSRKFAAIAEEHVLLQDFKPSLLYLRSFEDDSSTAKIHYTNHPTENYLRPLIPDSAFQSTQTEEEKIAQELKWLGQLVAIGAPGEILPRLGIPRFYIPHDNLEDIVRNLMLSVEWVVIRAGMTTGLLSEIEMAVKCVKPERLILVVPPQWRAENYQKFSQKIQKVIPCKLPPIYFPKDKSEGITTLLYFKSDWTSQDTVRSLRELLLEQEEAALWQEVFE
jgi:hypothetical protein